jgi:UrcA family protein
MKNETPPAHRSFNPPISIGAAALIAVFALTSVEALADQPPATRVATVSLTGLDLSTPEGARLAYERIKTTVKRLCFQILYNECLVDTLADTVRRINSPTVASLEKWHAKR